MSRNSRVGLLLAVFTGMANCALVGAWEKPPIKVDAAFNFRFNVIVGPPRGAGAPWYSYFPYDPNLAAPKATNPYPNWPSPFPPAEGSSNDKSASRFPNWPSHFPSRSPSGPEPENRGGQVAHVASATPQMPVGQATTWQTSFSVPSGSLARPPLVNGMQVPPYWYGR